MFKNSYSVTMSFIVTMSKTKKELPNFTAQQPE